jgi:hypothetical protein
MSRVLRRLSGSLRRSLLLTAALVALMSLGGVATPVAAPAVARTPTCRDVTIPAGTPLRVRLEQSLASNTSYAEQPIRAELTRSLVVNGTTVVPVGSDVHGVVTEAKQSARVKGRARLGMRFHTLTSPWSERRYAIRTSTWARQAPGTKKKDAAKIAIPAAGGSVIGAIAGGKKGAAIGAAAGGGAGTAVVLATRGEEVRLPRGSVLLVRLARPLTVSVRQS